MVVFASSACAALLFGWGVSHAAGIAISQKESSTSAPSMLASWQSRFEGRAFRTRSGLILPYRVAQPPADSARPLVLVLHGSGAMGRDNKAQIGPFASAWAQLLEDGPDAPIVVVPQVAQRSADYVICDGSPCRSKPGPSLGGLLELLDGLVASRAIDRNRVYVVGFSMGASAALQLALARPGVVSRMVLFAPVPPPKSRIHGLTSSRMLVVHGDRDTENPFFAMREWITLLNRAGGHVEMSVRHGMGHQIPNDMLTDVGWRKQLLSE